MEIRALFSTDTRQLDTAKQKLAGVGDAGQESGRDIAKGMKTAEKSTGVFQSALKGLGSVLGTIGLAYSLGGVITQNTAYANSLAEVSTLVNTTTFNMESLSDEALNQANRFGAMPVDGTKAFYQAISAGASSAAEATETMVDANKLAIGGVTDVKTAVDGLTSSNNAYGESAGGTTAISDSMFVAMKAGKTTIGELSSSIGNLAPISAQAGASFDEMMAATAALTKGGVSTSTAMDGLKGILASVIKPSGEASKMAASLGLEFNAAALKSKGFAEFLKDVTEKTGGSTEKMAMLFGGVEALAPMLALTGKASGDFAETLAAMANKAGATEEAFTKMSNSPGFQIKRILAGISAEFIKLGQGGTDVAVLALKTIADNLWIISTAGNFLIDVTGSVIDHLHQFGVVDAVSAAFRVAGDAINHVTGMFSGASGGITEFLGAFGAVAVTAGGASMALGIVGSAVSALGALLLANPISLTIAAIGAAVYLIYNNWDGVVAWWNELWGNVTAAASGFFDWWSNTTLIEKVADIATLQIDAAKSVATGFFTWWDQSTLKQHSPPIVTDAIESARQSINEFFTWWDNTSLKDKAADVTYETIIWAWDKAKAFKAWWNGLSLKSLIPEIKMPSIAGIKDSADGMWHGMKQIGSDLVGGVAEGIDKATSHITASEKMVSDVEATVKSAAQIRSPSKLMADLGIYIPEGFAVGIDKGAGKVKSAAQRVAEQAQRAFEGVVSGLEKQYLKLTEGEGSARRYELAMQGITGANQNAVIAAEAQIKSLQDQNAATEEAAKAAIANAEAQTKAAQAVQDAIDSINLGIHKQVLALTQGDEAVRRYELGLQKITGSAADAIIAAEQHVKSLTDQKKATEEAAAATAEFDKVVSDLHAGLDLQIVSLTQSDDALSRHELGLNGITGAELEAIVAKQNHIEQLKIQKQIMSDGLSVFKATRTDAEKLATETERLAKILRAGGIDADTHARAIESLNKQYDVGTKITAEYAKESHALADKIKVLEAGLGGNEDATRRAELELQKYNDAQIKGIMLDEDRIKTLERTTAEFDKLNAAAGGIADSLVGGDWSGALDQVKSLFIDPLKDKLSGALQSVLSSGSGGGLLGDLKSGFDGLMGGLSSSVSGLFGGGAIGGMLGALAPMGMVSAIIPLITKLFSSGPQEIKGKFGSFGGVVQQQQSVHDKDKRVFYQTGRSERTFQRTSEFGQFGLLSKGSVSIGRDDPKQIEGIHAALDAMEKLDAVAASFLSAATIDRIKIGLDGFEANALNTAQLTKKRLTIIYKNMDAELRKAFQGSENVMAGTAEEIAARFAYIAAVNDAQFAPAMESMGWNLGNTETKALAAAVGLTDAAGGLDKLKTGLESYYQIVFTAAERQELEKATAQTALDVFNAANNAHITSIESFRAYVEGLDKQTSKGQEATAAALGLTSAIAVLYGSADEASTGVSAAADTAASSIDNQAGATATLSSAANDAAYDLSSLKNNIADLVSELYGSTGTVTTSGTGVTDLSAAQSTLALLQDRYDTEQDRLTEINRLAQEAYRADLARYESLKSAAEDMRDFVLGWTRSNPLLTPFEQLQEVQRQYDSTLTAAQSGDVDAAKALQSLAGELRTAYTDVYASSTTSENAIVKITGDLSGIPGLLDGLAGTEPNDPGTITSTLLSQLEQQISSQQALISTLQSSQNSTNASTDRAALAQELATQIGALGLAMDQSVFDLLRENGIAIDALATDFGIDVAGLNNTLQTELDVLQSGISNLDSTVLTQLDGLADALHVDTVSLANELGTDIDLLGDVLAAQLSAQTSSMPADIKTSLAPYLSAIETSNDPTALRLAIAALQGRVDLLPPAIRDPLKEQLSGIVGNTDGITGNLMDLISSNQAAINSLASSFGIDVENLDSDMLTALGSLSSDFGVHTATLADSMGLDIDRLGDLMSDKLSSMPHIPDDIKAVLAPFLTNIADANDSTALRNAMGAIEFAINGVPADIQGQLSNQLQGIISSNSQASTVSAVQALQSYINSLPSGIKAQLNSQLSGILNGTNDTKAAADAVRAQASLINSSVTGLPPDIKAQLNSQLSGIVGNTSSTSANTSGTKTNTSGIASDVANGATAVQHLWAIRLHASDIDSQTDWTKAYVARIRDNVRAQNSNWSKSGSSNIASYRVGTDALPSDGLIMAHRHETIFNPQQSLSLRDKVLANMNVIPATFDLLQSAANDSDAAPQEIHIAPSVIDARPVSNQPRGNNDQEQYIKRLEEKLDGLTNEVKGLRKDRTGDVRVIHQQNDTRIRQCAESLGEQKRNRKDADRHHRSEQLNKKAR